MAFPKFVNLALRGLQFFWTLLIIALVGNMIAQATAGNPSIVNYVMFCAVFGMLSLFYLIPATISESFAFHPIIMVTVDGLNTLFFFCGAVALAAELNVHSCSDSDYTDSNKVTNGTSPGNREKRCREAQASDAFLWFGFATFVISTVASAMSGGSGGANLRGPRRGGTTTSRV